MDGRITPWKEWVKMVSETIGIKLLNSLKLICTGKIKGRKPKLVNFPPLLYLFAEFCSNYVHMPVGSCTWCIRPSHAPYVSGSSERGNRAGQSELYVTLKAGYIWKLLSQLAPGRSLQLPVIIIHLGRGQVKMLCTQCCLSNSKNDLFWFSMCARTFYVQLRHTWQVTLDHFQEPNWKLIGLPEISRATWQVCPGAPPPFIIAEINFTICTVFFISMHVTIE